MKLRSILQTVRPAFFAGLLAFALLGSLGFARTVNAASCDKVNIVYCGLGGSTAAGNIASFKQHYQNNQPSDMKAVANWGGFSPSIVSNMTTANSKLGTLNATNGNVLVDGKVVGRDTWMSARFGAGKPGFKHVVGDVYARNITTDHARDSYPVLITFNSDGQAIAGVVIDCGNTINFTPVKPPTPPKPALACVGLSKASQTNPKTFRFEVQANAENTTISGYTFSFGDGTADKTVKTTQKNAAITHTFAKNGQSFTVRATVLGEKGATDTSPKCVVKVSTPEKPVPPVKHPSVTILKTVSKPTVAINEEFTYTVRVTNNGDVALTKVVVTDQAPTNVAFLRASVGTVTSTSWTTTIATLAINQSVEFTITAKATATGTNIVNTACVNAPEVNPGEPTKSDACSSVPINVPTPPVVNECKPGIPEGDDRCDEVLGTTDEEELPNTGAGSAIALVSLVTILAASAHYFTRNGTPKFSFNNYDE